MYKLDSKKIDDIFKKLENAGKDAVKALNEMTENSFKDSPMEKDPLDNMGFLILTLKQAREQAALNVKYDGMTPEEVETAKAAEREAEKENLQKMVQEKLDKRKPAEPEPAEETAEEPAGDDAPHL